MNEEHEYYYDSDDDYEDINSDDEYAKYYLTDEQLDNLIYQIQQNGSQHTFYEIEAFLCSADEIDVYEWRQDLNEEYTKKQTINQIEKQLDKKFGKPSTRLTPPCNETTETSTSSHENDNRDTKINTELQKSTYNTASKVFTKPMQQKFLQAAFNHWKTAIPNIKAPHKLSPNAPIFISKSNSTALPITAVQTDSVPIPTTLLATKAATKTPLTVSTTTLTTSQEPTTIKETETSFEVL